MPKANSDNAVIRRKLKEAITALKELGFGPKQSNELAGYVLLALLDMNPQTPWQKAANPLRGVTPIIEYFNLGYL